MSSHRASTSSRPPSSTGQYMVPSTPKVITRNGGLSEKHLQKIESKLGSVRRPSANLRYSRREEQAGSFLPESSFTHAPLSSRLPAASPRRVSGRQYVSRGPSETYSATSPEIGTDHDENSIMEPEDVMVEDTNVESLNGLDRDLQEAFIVEDLLFVLMGIEGQYIEFDQEYSPEEEVERLLGARFVIDPELDTSLAAVVERILPVATHFTGITAFVDLYSALDYGVVNQALCAAIREMLRDYAILIVQLEHQFMTSPAFTLQTLSFHLQSQLRSLEVVYALTSKLVQLSNPVMDETGGESDSDNDAFEAIVNELKGGGGGGRQDIGIAKGGEVLAVISDLMDKTPGDPIALSLYSGLLLRASQPYATILLGWISTGHLSDPWEEFMVRENKAITKGQLDRDYTDEYWDRRYTLRDAGVKKKRVTISADGTKGKESDDRSRGLSGGAIVPKFLEKWKSKILLAGKYLNVIRECGIEIKIADDGVRGGAVEGVEGMALNDELFFKRMDAAYVYANRTLLKLLFEEQDLVSRLRSIKQYFFIAHGDFFTHFLDKATRELSKKAHPDSVPHLQSVLELALRSPAFSSSADSLKDELRIELGKETLTDWLLRVVNVTGDDRMSAAPKMVTSVRKEELKSAAKDGVEKKEAKEKPFTGFDALTLDFKIKFPLSLVTSRKTILRYQLLFRNLLQLKHLERELNSVWLIHKLPIWSKRSAPVKAFASISSDAAVLQSASLDQFKSRVFLLRSRMFYYVQQMYTFMVSEVLEVNWQKLEAKLKGVEMVDQLLRDHTDFLDTCLKECLLTNEDLLKRQSKLLNVCAQFSAYNAQFTKVLGGTIDETVIDKLKRDLGKFEDHFSQHSTASLERISLHASRENPALLPLVVRLSYLKV